MKLHVQRTVLCFVSLLALVYFYPQSKHVVDQKQKKQGSLDETARALPVQFEESTVADGADRFAESKKFTEQVLVGSPQPNTDSRHETEPTHLPGGLTLPEDVALATSSWTRSNDIEQRFDALMTLAEMKTEHGNVIEEAVIASIMAGDILGQDAVDAIEIINLESDVLKGKLLDWMMQLDDGDQRTALVSVFNELEFDSNQQAMIPGILRAWQQSGSENLRNAVAEVAIQAGHSDSALITAALVDNSVRVRYTMLLAMQASGKDWQELSYILQSISNDEMLPTDLRRISQQML